MPRCEKERDEFELENTERGSNGVFTLDMRGARKLGWRDAKDIGEDPMRPPTAGPREALWKEKEDKQHESKYTRKKQTSEIHGSNTERGNEVVMAVVRIDGRKKGTAHNLLLRL